MLRFFSPFISVLWWEKIRAHQGSDFEPRFGHLWYRFFRTILPKCNTKIYYLFQTIEVIDQDLKSIAAWVLLHIWFARLNYLFVYNKYLFLFILCCSSASSFSPLPFFECEMSIVCLCYFCSGNLLEIPLIPSATNKCTAASHKCANEWGGGGNNQ